MKGPFQNWEKMITSPVAVLGCGISGNGVCALLERLGLKYRVFDDQGCVITPSKLKSSSIVIVSPGFRPDHPWLLMARRMKKKVFGELDFASFFSESPITAITGTNGKSTIVTLLSHIFNKLGYNTTTAGNIGIPLSQLIADQVTPPERVFLEVSSFQSRSLSFLEPQQGIWTNFAEDHLNYHGSMEDYFQSKLSLLRRCQGDVFVGESVQIWAKRLSLNLPSQVRVIRPYSLKDSPISGNCFFNTLPQRENFALARAFAISLGVSVESFNHACLDYTPEPHRLAKINQIENVSFWNDSKATNFNAVIAACKSLRKPIYWIGGGQSKGISMDLFARELNEHIQRAYVIGEVGEEMVREFNTFDTPAVQCFSLQEAVECAYSEAKGSVSILFSPGFASFDQFRDYKDRGNIFNKSVLNLKKKFATTTQELLY